MTPASRAMSSVDRSYGWQHIPRGRPRLLEQRIEQGAQVGHPAVVPDDQLVQLTAGRDVLVLEGLGAPRLGGT